MGRGAGAGPAGDPGVYTDPNVPPLPPHITLKDAKNFMTHDRRREPELGSVLKNTRQGGAGSVLPAKKS